HPGYGFLSENAAFARACAAQGLVFVGPPGEAIDEMGDKARARERMRGAGVPVVPGSEGTVATVAEALARAETIGYPVILKAAAGGGGIGMVPVEEPKRMEKAFRRAADRAGSSFGSADLYVEKYLHHPRHIEVQVFADRFGDVVHLHERECSIQRRHQKIIEETPSPLFADGAHADVRAAMFEAATRATRTLGYQGAGTIEFLVDADANFYFIEMNTRLQVEHTVTEQVTGLDLVEAQLRVAAGEPLPFRQEDVRPLGHSIQLRIYAEDPARQFLPSPGRIVRYVRPAGPGIRLDCGVDEGFEISAFYDPMIAKLVGHGESRAHAIERLVEALDGYTIDGIRTNIEFHREALASERFRRGELATDFVDDLIRRRPKVQEEDER
ncbi:MAG: ATP-grasp domain-containing protein, partial [Myxococcales bacterium]|nr:ATP-grasp domain-containing protein [Myxococcales bacterium]